MIIAQISVDLCAQCIVSASFLWLRLIQKITFLPLDQIQNFSYVPSKCLNETVMNRKSGAITTKDCANVCAAFPWCCSYNWYQEGMHCEFVSWYYNDTSNVATGVYDCY